MPQSHLKAELVFGGVEESTHAVCRVPGAGCVLGSVCALAGALPLDEGGGGEAQLQLLSAAALGPVSFCFVSSGALCLVHTHVGPSRSPGGQPRLSLCRTPCVSSDCPALRPTLSNTSFFKINVRSGAPAPPCTSAAYAVVSEVNFLQTTHCWMVFLIHSANLCLF